MTIPELINILLICYACSYLYVPPATETNKNILQRNLPFASKFFEKQNLKYKNNLIYAQHNYKDSTPQM